MRRTTPDGRDARSDGRWASGRLVALGTCPDLSRDEIAEIGVDVITRQARRQPAGSHSAPTSTTTCCRHSTRCSLRGSCRAAPRRRPRRSCAPRCGATSTPAFSTAGPTGPGGTQPPCASGGRARCPSSSPTTRSEARCSTCPTPPGTSGTRSAPRRAAARDRRRRGVGAPAPSRAARPGALRPRRARDGSRRPARKGRGTEVPRDRGGRARGRAVAQACQHDGAALPPRVKLRPGGHRRADPIICPPPGDNERGRRGRLDEVGGLVTRPAGSGRAV